MICWTGGVSETEEQMNLIEKIKAIEIYVCENFEELGLDDPVEEEYFSAYEEIKGA